jgi:hypothetical protein
LKIPGTRKDARGHRTKERIRRGHQRNRLILYRGGLDSNVGNIGAKARCPPRAIWPIQDYLHGNLLEGWSGVQATFEELDRIALWIRNKAEFRSSLRPLHRQRASSDRHPMRGQVCNPSIKVWNQQCKMLDACMVSRRSHRFVVRVPDKFDVSRFSHLKQDKRIA